MSEIAEDFSRYAAKLRHIPELQALPETSAQAHTQLGRLLRPLRSGTHPIRHFVLIDWLFGSASVFLDAYALHNVDAKEGPAVVAATASSQPKLTAPQQLPEWLKAGESLRSIARRCGVDVGTVMAWAGKFGVEHARRPKLLTTQKRLALVQDLSRGMHKPEAARLHGISVVTVTRVLQTEPGLQERWHRIRFHKMQAQSRQRWANLLESHAHLGAKYLRAMCPADYAWLYRNDRAWLQKSMADIRTVRPPKRSSVDWDKRDAALAADVEKAALRVAQAHPGKRIKLWQLYHEVPELKAKLSALDRLPLTRRVLDRVTGKAAAQTPNLLD